MTTTNSSTTMITNTPLGRRSHQLHPPGPTHYWQHRHRPGHRPWHQELPLRGRHVTRQLHGASAPDGHPARRTGPGRPATWLGTRVAALTIKAGPALILR